MTDATPTDEITPEALDRIYTRVLEAIALQKLQRRIGEANTAKGFHDESDEVVGTITYYDGWLGFYPKEIS